MIRATFELEPEGSAHALAIMESTGMPEGPSGPSERETEGPSGPSERETEGPSDPSELETRPPAGAGAGGASAEARGRVVFEGGGRAVVEFPDDNWGRNVPLLVSALVAGEATEADAFSRCRLVDLDLPDGLLPGPAFGAAPSVGVGVIVKPSLGLGPAQVADVARAAAAGGACFVKDDELLADPPWCPLEERVRAVAKALPLDVVYCPNVSGPTPGLLDRARRAVELGASGVMVNAFAQGLDALLTLRDAELGVPLLGHRVGSGPLARNGRFGASGSVLTRLTRRCGADFVIAGAFGGKLFENEDQVRANLEAARGPCRGALPSFAVLGGGLGADDARRQADTAGGTGLVILLGSRAYAGPGGLEGSVRAAVEAVSS